MPVLEVKNLEKRFGSTRVLNDISFSLEKGQALSIIGSSGSGKTTLLRCLNFLETPNGGSITVNGKTLFDAKDPSTQLEKEIRRKRLHFGLVFQNFNLFPQYTALQNVTLARELMSKESGESHDAIVKAGKELLDQMGLADRANHYPHQLSGGQQQRVAIARALALHPDILCFDEPTSALDPELTGEVLRVIRNLRAAHDHDHRHSRDDLRPRRCRPADFYGSGPHCGAGRSSSGHRSSQRRTYPPLSGALFRYITEKSEAAQMAASFLRSFFRDQKQLIEGNVTLVFRLIRSKNIADRCMILLGNIP